MDEFIFVLLTILGIIIYAILSGVVMYGILSIVVRIYNSEWPGFRNLELWEISYKVSSILHLLITIALMIISLKNG